MAKIDKKRTPPSWIELPGDLTANIIRRLGAVEILQSTQCVCTTWRRACRDPAMWRVIDFTTYPFENKLVHQIYRICRYAVDCSPGELIDVTFEKHCTDLLLKYVCERSPNLKCLTLCRGVVSGESLIAAVKNLPRLEELHLLQYVIVKIYAAHVETVGKSCPALRSFSCGKIRNYSNTDDNDYALAVAKSMSNLRHLQLLNLNLKNEGVLAVVEHCPYLESLDLRLCSGTNLLQGIVCWPQSQIKNLRRPGDSTDDYKWKVEWRNIYRVDCCLVYSSSSSDYDSSGDSCLVYSSSDSSNYDSDEELLI